MSNILEYLEDWGNLTLQEARFNEVDNLILSTIAYGNWAGILPGLGGGEVSVRTAAARYEAMHGKASLEAGKGCVCNAPVLLGRMAASRRFGDVLLGNFLDIVDTKEDIQLSAMTARLSDGTLYVAFRGTDSTLVGWKEDFQFSYKYRTTGQVAAAQYLNRVAGKGKTILRVGGHSKGGHFAVYAAAFCEPEVKKRIFKVYSNDGPGVHEGIAASAAYRSILPMVIKLIPEESIVGLLLQEQGDVKIIKSSERGILQHDPATWEVEGDHFARAMSVSHATATLDATIANWLAGLSPEEKRRFTEALFSVLEFSGAQTVDELRENSLATAAGVVAAMASLPAGEQRLLWEIIARLADSGRQTIFSNLAMSQIRSAVNMTQAISGVTQAGTKLLSDLTRQTAKLAGGLIPGARGRLDELPRLSALMDDKIMTPEVKELMEKYDQN